MEKIIYSFAFLLILRISLAQTVVSNASYEALDPSFTQKNKNEIVLSWIEKRADGVHFFRKTWKIDQQKWLESEELPIDRNASTHAEGMPKLSYKKSGECIMLYEINKPSTKTRFSGDLKYAMESQGKWSQAIAIHQDTTAGLSHSFGKIIPLANGEVGAFWLDVKAGPKGRTLVHAVTSPGKGFGKMQILDKQTCECCRIDAVADEKGGLAIVYRDLNDQGERDMSFLQSTNFGKVFSQPVPLFEDHWEVNACPHAGPSLAKSSKELEAAWYTGAEGSKGIKWMKVGNKQMILHLKGEKFRMPQLASNSAGETALVYAEIKQKEDNYFKQIQLATKIGSKITTISVSQDLIDCSNPAIIGNGKGYLIAYQAEGKILVSSRTSDTE